MTDMIIRVVKNRISKLKDKTDRDDVRDKIDEALEAVEERDMTRAVELMEEADEMVNG